MTKSHISIWQWRKLRLNFLMNYVCLPQHPHRKSFQMKISVESSSFSPPCMRFHRKISYSVDVLVDKFHEFPSLQPPLRCFLSRWIFPLNGVKYSSLRGKAFPCHKRVSRRRYEREKANICCQPRRKKWKMIKVHGHEVGKEPIGNDKSPSLSPAASPDTVTAHDKFQVHSYVSVSDKGGGHRSIDNRITQILLGSESWTQNIDPLDVALFTCRVFLLNFEWMERESESFSAFYCGEG
jgi:hypothetical protein